MNISRTKRYCITQIRAHLIFFTKHRGQVLSATMAQELQDILSHICEAFEAILIEYQPQPDYIHFIVEYPPKLPLSKLINALKSVSVRLLKKKYPELTTKTDNGSLWSPSYIAVSYGQDSNKLIEKKLQTYLTFLES